MKRATFLLCALLGLPALGGLQPGALVREAGIRGAWAEDDRPERQAADPGLQHAINGTINRGIAYLKKAQNRDGSWTYDVQGGMPVLPGGGRTDGSGGLTALALYALSASGLPADDPTLEKGLEYLDRNPRAFTAASRYGTYSASLLVLALTRIDPDEHRKRIHELARVLVDSQLENHMWTYRLRKPEPRSRSRPRRRRDSDSRQPAGLGRGGDNSNTLFAVLALWAAQEIAGAKVPKALWQEVAAFYEATQLPGGGWAYHAPGRSTRGTLPEPRHGMTAAGLVSYVYARAAQLGGAAKLLEARTSEVAKHGLAAFAAEPVAPYTDRYLLYGLERVGTVLDRPSIEWYDTAARALTLQQEDDGRWPGHARVLGARMGDPKGAAASGVRMAGHGDSRQVYDTALVLLFLSKATTYVVTPR